MSDNNGYRELASTGKLKLTPKQQHFADLLAAGVSDSDAYRKAYDAENMAPATIQREAHALANHPKITTALADLRAVARQEAQIDARDLIAKLQGIADAPVQEPIRASDKIAAVREIGRLAGLYRDDRADRDQRPVVTQITVVLNHGRGGTATEKHQVVDSGTSS